MNIQSKLTAVFEKAGNEYIAYIEEIPGVNTQGATIDEAKANLMEALQLILEVRREMAVEEQAGKTIIKEEIKMSSAPQVLQCRQITNAPQIYSSFAKR